jgi:hypothetical protein
MNEQQLTAVKQAVESMMDADRLLEDEGYGRAYQQEAITDLQSIISQDALDKMAENARELGLDYEPAVIQQMVDALDHADELLGGNDTLVMNGAAAGRWLLEQPAAPKGWKLVPVMPAAWIDSVMEQAQVFASAWSLVGSRFDSGNEMENAEQAKAELRVMLISPPTPQPVPVKTYHDGKPWPVAPKPWVGLTDEEAQWIYDNGRTPAGMMEMVEAKLKEKNT